MIKTISIYTERRQYIYLEFISELSITPEALLCIICLKNLKQGKRTHLLDFLYLVSRGKMAQDPSHSWEAFILGQVAWVWSQPGPQAAIWMSPRGVRRKVEWESEGSSSLLNTPRSRAVTQVKEARSRKQKDSFPEFRLSLFIEKIQKNILRVQLFIQCHCLIFYTLNISYVYELCKLSYHHEL